MKFFILIHLSFLILIPTRVMGGEETFCTWESAPSVCTNGGVCDASTNRCQKDSSNRYVCHFIHEEKIPCKPCSWNERYQWINCEEAYQECNKRMLEDAEWIEKNGKNQEACLLCTQEDVSRKRCRKEQRERCGRLSTCEDLYRLCNDVCKQDPNRPDCKQAGCNQEGYLCQETPVCRPCTREDREKDRCDSQGKYCNSEGHGFCRPCQQDEECEPYQSLNQGRYPYRCLEDLEAGNGLRRCVEDKPSDRNVGLNTSTVDPAKLCREVLRLCDSEEKRITDYCRNLSQLYCNGKWEDLPPDLPPPTPPPSSKADPDGLMRGSRYGNGGEGGSHPGGPGYKLECNDFFAWIGNLFGNCPPEFVWDSMKGGAWEEIKAKGLIRKNLNRFHSTQSSPQNQKLLGPHLRLIDVGKWLSYDEMAIAYQDLNGGLHERIRLFSKLQKTWKGPGLDVKTIAHTLSGKPLGAHPELVGLEYVDGAYYATVLFWAANIGTGQYEAWPMIISLNNNLQVNTKFGNGGAIALNPAISAKMNNSKLFSATAPISQDKSSALIKMSDLVSVSEGMMTFVRDNQKKVYSVYFDLNGNIKHIQDLTSRFVDVPEKINWDGTEKMLLAVIKAGQSPVEYHYSFLTRYGQEFRKPTVMKDNVPIVIQWHEDLEDMKIECKKNSNYVRTSPKGQLEIMFADQSAQSMIGDQISFSPVRRNASASSIDSASFGRKDLFGTSASTQHRVKAGRFIHLPCFDETLGIWAEYNPVKQEILFRGSISQNGVKEFGPVEITTLKLSDFSGSAFKSFEITSPIYLSPETSISNTFSVSGGILFQIRAEDNLGQFHEELVYYQFSIALP